MSTATHRRPLSTALTPVSALALVTALVLLAASTLAPGSAPAAGASLPTIERQVMCVTCKIPLNVAESAQASHERALIRRLIAEGRSEAQIKRDLVAEYGPAVLALPSAKGFDLTAYAVPAAVLVALVAVLAVLLPGWRRRARTRRDGADGADVAGRAQRLTPSEAARLQADLDRFD
jgi:cytochrome c-type biogenesis protein CcmH/NrfF